MEHRPVEAKIRFDDSICIPEIRPFALEDTNMSVVDLWTQSFGLVNRYKASNLACCLETCGYSLANEMRYIIDLAIFILCVSRVIAAADDHPGGLITVFLRSVKALVLVITLSPCTYLSWVTNKIFMALSRTVTNGKHARPVYHPRIVLRCPVCGLLLRLQLLRAL